MGKRKAEGGIKAGTSKTFIATDKPALTKAEQKAADAAARRAWKAGIVLGGRA